MRVWVLSAACLASASLLPNTALSFTPQHAPALRTVAGGVQCSARGTDAGVAADPAARLRRAVGAPLVVAVGTAIALTSPLSVIADVAAPPAPVFRLAAITLPDDWSVATTEDGKEYALRPMPTPCTVVLLAVITLFPIGHPIEPIVVVGITTTQRQSRASGRPRLVQRTQRCASGALSVARATAHAAVPCIIFSVY